MTHAIKENPYALLAHFLSPWKTRYDIEALQRLIKGNVVQWEQLLLQANNNLCTPLWYVCLKNDCLLQLLPKELRKYLRALYEANLERNAFFVDALLELHEKFNENNIPFILLKGGAALCDNLYNRSGARLLQDIDILVKPENAEYAWEILAKSRYEEIPDPGKEFEGLPTDSRHHHLNSQRKPDTPVVIEIHYKIGYAKVGELLPAHIAWENTEEIQLSRARLHILNPTMRLIHNTAHGLMPHAEFIKGAISLQQLSEFAFIAKKHSANILWHDWLARSKENGLETQFLTYLILAQNLMGMELPAGLTTSWIPRLNAARISAVGKYCISNETLKKSRWQKIWSRLIRYLLRSYYLLRLPEWVWQNVCYTEGGGNTFMRIKYLFKKTVSLKSRSKI